MDRRISYHLSGLALFLVLWNIPSLLLDSGGMVLWLVLTIFCRGGGLAVFLYTFRKKEKLLAWWCSLPGTAYVTVNICIATAVLMEVALELLLRFR